MLAPKLAFIPRLIGGGSGDGDKVTIYGFVVGAITQTSPTILEPKPEHSRPIFARALASHRIERAVGKLAFPGQTAASEGRGCQQIYVPPGIAILQSGIWFAGCIALFEIRGLQFQEFRAEA